VVLLNNSAAECADSPELENRTTDRTAHAGGVIQIERSLCDLEGSPGIFEYRIPSLGIEGRSRQPLLDACRAINAQLGDCTGKIAAIYRKGRTEPDMRCPVEVGAAYTVEEPDRGRIRFRKYKPFDQATRRARIIADD
jgi:hypothetical protein